MGRIIASILIVVIAAYALTVAVPARPGVVALAPAVQTASVADALTPGPAAGAIFEQAGTLVFYPNNVGPVPYLFYRASSGRTVSKALVFMSAPPANLSSWAGAHVSVSGMLEQEHILVETITYLSAP